MDPNSIVPPLEGLTGRVIAAAMAVHTALGPGLLESAYQACLVYELRSRGLEVEVQKALPIRYRDVLLDVGFRVDIVVDGLVVIEIKSTRSIEGIHLAQLLTYLKLADKQVGLILNFNVVHMRNGIKRVVNG